MAKIFSLCFPLLRQYPIFDIQNLPKKEGIELGSVGLFVYLFLCLSDLYQESTKNYWMAFDEIKTDYGTQFKVIK